MYLNRTRDIFLPRFFSVMIPLFVVLVFLVGLEALPRRLEDH